MATSKTVLAAYQLERAIANEQRTAAACAANHVTDKDKMVAVAHQDTTIKCDDELARLAIGLKLALCFRLWLVLIELCRTTGHLGFTRAQIRAALVAYNVKYTEQQFRRWLHRGHGLFWQFHNEMVYPLGYLKLAERLTAYAIAHHLENLVITNQPGARKPMYITVSSTTIDQFKANVFAAWIAARGGLTISYHVLQQLFRVDHHSIRAWCKSSGVEIVHNYAFILADHTDAIPLDADGHYRHDVEFMTINGRQYVRINASNSYHAPRIRQHNSRGKSRRVHTTIRNTTETLQPDSLEREGKLDNTRFPVGSKPSRKLYYEQSKRARASCKKHGEQPRYVWLGADDRNIGIWVYAPSGGTDLDFWAAAGSLHSYGCNSAPVLGVRDNRGDDPF